VGTYSAWECTATLRLLGSARQGEERAGAYCVATRTAYCSYECFDFAAIIFITKLRSSHRHQRTSTNFLQLDALPVAQPTLSEHWRKTVSHSTDMLSPSSHGSSNLDVSVVAFSSYSVRRPLLNTYLATWTSEYILAFNVSISAARPSTSL